MNASTKLDLEDAVVREIRSVLTGLGHEISWEDVRAVFDNEFNHDQRHSARKLIRSGQHEAFGRMICAFLPPEDLEA